MAKIPLRAYISEIETIIEHKQTEEAIAHCRHILQVFPKHIDTYSMLGKAYLESQRYGNAADIFQRVLSAVPDDFISHVGMSIIREDENNLDAAIWHMERAFEGQPYNGAIQGELRRLYGKRDGMEPPKVHLTSGALARMYVKGDLYQQAIAELRTALAEDPQRFDLQVFLAQMYAQSGQDAKAIETCGNIINKLPYCYQANRILAQILENTDRSEEAQTYKKRVQELNPYEAYIGPSAMTESQVPAQAVMIEQLIWDGGPATAAADQPEWATSVGVDIDESRLLGESLPDWMSETTEEGAPALPASLAEEADAGEQIPDWMKEAGWEPSTGEFDESKSVVTYDDEESELADDSEAVAGEIPEWLQDIAPPGAIESPDEIAETDADLPDWLADQVSESSTPSDEEGELPDWLAPAAGAAAVAGAAAALSNEEQAEAADETIAESRETPDWLEDLEGAEGETTETEAAEVPDWLQDVAPEEATPAAEIEEEKLGAEEFPAEPEAAEMPEWLQEAGEEEALEFAGDAEEGELPDWLAPAAGAAAVAGAAAADETIAESRETSDWLEDLEGAKGETAEIEAAEVPDWLQEIAPEEATPAAEIEEEKLGAEELSAEPEAAEMPEWLQEAADEEAPEIAGDAEEGELPDWLTPAAGAAAVAGAAAALSDEEPPEEAAEEEKPVAEELPAEPEVAEMPEWLQEASEEETQEITGDAEEGELPDWLATAAGAATVAGAAAALSGEEPPEDVTEEEILDWLHEVAPEGEEPTSIAEVETEFPVTEAELVEAEPAEVPEWIQEAGEEEAPAAEATVEPPVAEAEPVEAELAEVPEWIQEAGEEEAPAVEATVEPFVAEAESAEADSAVTPDQLQQVAVEETQEPSPEEEKVPTWLQEAIEQKETGDLPAPDISEGEIPEWIQDVAEDAETETILEEGNQAIDIAKTIGIAGAAAAGVAAVMAEDEEPQPEAPQAMEDTEAVETEGIEGFEWASDFDEIEEGEGELETGTIISDELPDWLQEIPEETTVSKEVARETSIEDEEIPAWMHDISDEVPSIAGETELTTEMPAEPEIDDIPSWMQDIAEEETTVVDEVSAPEPEKTTEEPAAPDLADADAAMAWLEGLAAKQGVSEDELLTSPEQRSETPPDWVQESITQEEEVSEIAAEQTLTEPVAEEIPEWLSEAIEAEEPEPMVSETEETPEEPKLEVPEFLQDVGVTDLEVVGITMAEELEEAQEPVTDLEGVSAEAEEVTSDFADADAAMAWLEGLAAKQGVSEDELLTSPEERGETPPEWIQETMEAEEEPVEEPISPTEAEPTAESEAAPDWIADTEEPSEPPEEIIETSEEISAIEAEPIPLEEPESIKEERAADSDFTDAAAALAWLDSLATGEGVSDEELLTTPEKPGETTPDWMPESVEEEPVTEEEMRDWIAEVPEAVESDETVEEPEALEEEAPPLVGEAATDVDFEDADAALAWLESLAVKQGVSEDELLTSPEERSDTPPEWVQDAIEAEETTAKISPPEADDLPVEAEPPESSVAEIPVEETSLPISPGEAEIAPPSWVSDGEIPEDDEYSWLPEDVSEAISAETEESIDLNQASLIQLERLPGVGFRRAQAITAYRDEHGDFASFDELYNIPGLDEETIDLLRTRVNVVGLDEAPATEAAPEAALFAPQEGEPEDDSHEQQLDAQAKLTQGDIPAALEEYAALIEKGQRLDDVIEDLNKAAEKYPEEITIFQKLGDACIQANRLEEALEAYTKAENLLS